MLMGYTKLFSEIVMSTVWREKDTTRLVWITMLALRNRHHVVDGSVPGLADCARVSIKACRAALKVLSEPDPDSRSQELDGRRIQEVDGGWFIINGEKYRRKMSEDERREKNAIYQKNHRDRKKSVSSQADISAKSAQTEEETETKKNKNGGANGSRPTSVEDWLIKLEQNPTYKGINVRQLHGRMVTWCEIRGLKPTLRRLVTWLNKEDKPMPKHSSRADYKRNYAPPAREPTQEELDNARRIAHEETARFKEEQGR